MALNEKIDDIVPDRVQVTHDPKIENLTKPLSGSKTAIPGSPAGREAKPAPKQDAWAGTLKGVYD